MSVNERTNNAEGKDRLIRRPGVQESTGLSRSTLYALIAKGQFPAPIRISERSVAWSENAVQGWVEQRIENSRKPSV